MQDQQQYDSIALQRCLSDSGDSGFNTYYSPKSKDTSVVKTPHSPHIHWWISATYRCRNCQLACRCAQRKTWRCISKSATGRAISLAVGLDDVVPGCGILETSLVLSIFRKNSRRRPTDS